MVVGATPAGGWWLVVVASHQQLQYMGVGGLVVVGVVVGSAWAAGHGVVVVAVRYGWAAYGWAGWVAAAGRLL